MIIWVAELSAKAVGQEFVYVATEDTRIFDLVESAGFKAVMTSVRALTGTDRLAEASEKIDADIYINVQGDEPTLNPIDIQKISDKTVENMELGINAYCWISKHEKPESGNIPKVITNENNKLIYISRKALPGFKNIKNAPTGYKKQVCIYGFTKEELLAFKNFGRQSTLEYSEDIEILRFFELDKSILMVETQGGSLAIDVPEDIAPVETALKQLHRI